jgi:GntR family transcriptional regulator / MocR family aminotransferase
MELVIPLASVARAGRDPLHRQVYAALRTAILGGRLRAGERLPSTRELADQLGISRTVVVIAYEQLLAEGFATGRGGSGTYVSDVLTSRRAGLVESPAQVRLSRYGAHVAALAPSLSQTGSRDIPPPHAEVARESATLRYDFAYGRSDVDHFPFEVWRRILLRCARNAPVRELDYAASSGSDALREAVCAHLRRSRAVSCEPSQVMIVNGSQQALDLIARVLIERGDRVVIEDPSYQGTREVLRAAGARLHAMPVDREGLNPADLPDGAKMAFVTPSHQFPTGAILSLARRQLLLEWARRRNAVIVEDDYDGEFRYKGQRLESLQGMDTQGRVIYVGTFSRTIFSALRIGYMIVPKALQGAFAAAKWLCDRHTATLEQEALAAFISTGLYERHLRRLRKRNAAAREVLLESIERYLGDRVEVTGDGSGAHVVLWLRGARSAKASEQEAVARAAARDVGVYGIAQYFSKAASRPGVLLGYSRMRERDIREGIRRLGEIL